MILSKSEVPDYLDSIAALRNRVFDQSDSEEVLKWRHLDCPSDAGCVGIEFIDGELVASYAATVWQLVYRSETYRIATTLDAMVDSRFQGRGIFGRLGTEVTEWLHEQGCAFTLTYPTREISHLAHTLSMKWDDIYEMPQMSLRLENATRRSKVDPALLREIQPDDNFRLKYRPYILDCDLMAVTRSAADLQWRYAQHPTNTYKNIVIADDENNVTSYCVYKRYGDSFDLVELRSSSKEQADALMEHMIVLALDRGILSINCWAPLHHYLCRVCELRGFRRATPITCLVGKCSSSYSFIEEAMLDYRNWYQQMGDSDVY